LQTLLAAGRNRVNGSPQYEHKTWKATMGDPKAEKDTVYRFFQFLIGEIFH